MTLPFRLYPEEQHWWSASDYQAVLDVMQRLQPKRVLEFGPGSSTLALIEGCAETIDCYEDDPAWLATYQDRLAGRFPEIVKVLPYTFSDPLRIPGLRRGKYDLALIDGPYDTPRRPAVLEFCLRCCDAVLIPTEDYKVASPPLRPHIERLAKKFKRHLEITETGPLSGAFALLTREEASC